MRQLNVHMLPELVHPHDMAGNVVVVVDVLRATTTIATAIANGAKAVIPCLEVEEARGLCDQHRSAGTSTLLAGERRGLPINGFDLGNSPSEYSTSAVTDYLIVFTTTNGTKALTRCVGAARVIMGAFVNLSSVWEAVAKEPIVEIVCAGTDGSITREDVLFAGALVDRTMLAMPECELNDQSRLAADAWRKLGIGPSTAEHPLREALRETRGGQNLIKIGHEADIDLSAEIDTINVVPELDLSTWRIQ